MRTILFIALFIAHLEVLLLSPLQAQIALSNPVTVSGATIGAPSPEGIAFHPLTNTLFVLDSNIRLIQLDLAGNRIDVRQLGLSEADGIAYDPVTGDLLISGGSTIHQFRTDGTFVMTLIDLSATNLNDVEGIAVHPLDGNIWIVDDSSERIAELDRTGAVLRSFNTVAFANGFNEPQGLDFFGLDLLVADDSGGTQTLYLVSTSGQLLQVVGQTSNFGLFDPEGVAVASGSRIWMAGDDDANLVSVDISGLSPSGPLKLYFAQFGNGALGEVVLESDFVLPNPSATDTASGTVAFFAADGGFFPTGVDGQGTTSLVPFSVGPLDSATISTTGEGDFGTGTAVVSSDNPLGGVIRFNISAPPGIGSGIAGVPASQIVSGFVTPVRRTATGINTGVAIRIVGNDQVTLNLSLRGADGMEVASGFVVRMVTGDGQLVEFINTLFPNADTSNFVGSLVVTAVDGMIAATAIEQGTNPGEFTTLPVTPLEE